MVLATLHLKYFNFPKKLTRNVLQKCARMNENDNQSAQHLDNTDLFNVNAIPPMSVVHFLVVLFPREGQQDLRPNILIIDYRSIDAISC